MFKLIQFDYFARFLITYWVFVKQAAFYDPLSVEMWGPIFHPILNTKVDAAHGTGFEWVVGSINSQHFVRVTVAALPENYCFFHVVVVVGLAVWRDDFSALSRLNVTFRDDCRVYSGEYVFRVAILAQTTIRVQSTAITERLQPMSKRRCTNHLMCWWRWWRPNIRTEWPDGRINKMTGWNDRHSYKNHLQNKQNEKWKINEN